MEYYIYCYIDEKKDSSEFGDYMFNGEPFYIGMGQKDRCYDHIFNSQKNEYKYLPKHYKIRKMLNEENEPKIIKLLENLSQEEAIKNEIYFIDLIGRKDLKKGPLLNLTDGGEGGNTEEPWNKGLTYSIEGHSQRYIGENNPFYGKKHSEETKRKISRSNKGNSYKKGFVCSKETKQRMKDSRPDCNGKNNSFFGKTHTKETKDKISKANKGKLTGNNNPSKRDDVRQKISNSNSKTYKITNPNGEEIIYKGNLRVFCEEKNLVVQLLRDVAKDRRIEYKGWKCEYIK